MLKDLRFGLKLLWKEKAFTLTALLTLALCIGANTAIFSVLNTVILEPLPYDQPERLVTLYNVYPAVGVRKGSNGVPDYLDRRKLTGAFDSLALIGFGGYDLGSEGAPQRLQGHYVTPDFFTVLRGKPLLGRLFTAEEAVLGKELVVVLSEGLWKEQFAGNRNVLGKDMRLSGRTYRIIGVMPSGFGRELGGSPARLWVPFAFRPDQTSDDARHSNNWGMIGRLKTGVSLAQAQQQIDALNRRNLDAFPKYRKILEDARFGTQVASLKEEIIEDIRPTLFLLQAVVGFVLLIGCVNVANLMLIRANVRMKEMAIRFSLGARRLRLARQLLTESVLLSLIGGALGVLVGFGGIRLLAALGAEDLPRGAQIGMSGAVLAFTAAAAVLTGLVFGSVPVFHLFRRDLNSVFRQNDRGGTAEHGSVWTRSALVVCQVAVAFVLLVGAGLLTMSFSRLLAVNPGFRPEQVLTAEFSLPFARYGEDAQRRAFIDRLMEQARALPGARQVGFADFLPFTGNNNSSVIGIAGRPLKPGDLPPVPAWNRVDFGYFQAMGIPILKGRGIQASDGPDSQPVVVIDRYLERKYWPKGDAIGAAILRGLDEKEEKPWTIVGVVGEVKTGDLAESAPVGQIYFPYPQFPTRGGYLVVKSTSGGEQLVSGIRRLVQQADSELPIFDVKTMPERLARSVGDRRAAVVLCLIFGGLALALSAIGIYGVLAYGVTQRTREFGIRTALGAQVRDVLGMVLSQGLKLAAAGLLIGIGAALLLTRLMTTLLYGVKPSDPLVFAGGALVLAAVAAVASLVPSVRAARITPSVALRHE